ncbi:hypothetical protein WOLCODRAFT_165295 [Wolfiporia cocos MD-104 SS10]|uniref:tRNA ligase phosphodiesterase domain-containing protein n=1 Tax=Wolfiporia cocos (strain MD-104) TaxID=742152 RepID=A0A2H3K3C6_WOLCO|nr:hypothetical protein WOLCODRAFT_165295 [Wolfiporia cocos MD-104 SS10]
MEASVLSRAYRALSPSPARQITYCADPLRLILAFKLAQEVDEVTKEKESEVENQNSQNKPLVQEPPQPQMPKIEEQNGTTEIKSGTVNIEQEGILEQKKTKKPMAPNYEIGVRCYSIIPDVDLRKVVEQALPTEIQAMWKERCQSGHLASTTHIQLAHYRMRLHHRGAEVWRWCWSFLTKRDPVWFHFRLTHLVWDDRIVLAVVDGLEFDASEARNAGVKAEDGNVFVDGLPDWICSSLHIILVKNNEKVSPGEARALVRQWKEAPQSVNSIPLDDVQGKGYMRKFFGRILKLNYLRNLMAQRREEKQEKELSKQEVANR